jgi:hypothetical protein
MHEDFLKISHNQDWVYPEGVLHLSAQVYDRRTGSSKSTYEWLSFGADKIDPEVVGIRIKKANRDMQKRLPEFSVNLMSCNSCEARVGELLLKGDNGDYYTCYNCNKSFIYDHGSITLTLLNANDPDKNDRYDDAYARYVSAATEADQAYWFNQMLAQVDIKPHPMPELVPAKTVTTKSNRNSRDMRFIVSAVFLFAVFFSILCTVIA